MNISSGEIEEQEIDNVMELIGRTLKSRKVEEEKENESNNKMEIKDIMKNVNKLIGKKRRGKVICDEDEDNEENFQDDKSLNSFISANTIISRNRIKKDNKKGKGKSKSKLKDSKKRNNNKNKNDSFDDYKDEDNFSKDDDSGIKPKKLYKRKKIQNPGDLSGTCQHIFKRIIEAGKQRTEDEKRKEKIIEEIQEKTQLLTPEGLKEYAKLKHIKIIDNQFSIYELKQKSNNQLDAILSDIDINGGLINKLDVNRKDNIKTIRNKEEREKKKNEKNMKKKKMKENKKNSENKNPNNNNINYNDNRNQKMDSDDDTDINQKIDVKKLTVKQAIDRGNKILEDDSERIKNMKKVVGEDVDTMREVNRELNRQNEALDNAENNLKEIDFSLKRASKQVKTMFKMYATDKLIMCMIVVILLVIIAIVIASFVGNKNNNTNEDQPHDIFTKKNATSRRLFIG